MTPSQTLVLDTRDLHNASGIWVISTLNQL